jgi:hypothetical protein
MHLEILYSKSGVKCYGISSSEAVYSEKIGVLTISEKYWPRTPRETAMPSGVQNYVVVIEATVPTLGEAWKAKLNAFDLASNLDKAWIYVCGEHLHHVSMTLLFIYAGRGADKCERD